MFKVTTLYFVTYGAGTFRWQCIRVTRGTYGAVIFLWFLHRKTQ